MMRWWRLSWRLLLRDARAGELSLLAVALIIAVAATSAIGFFTDRIQRTMGQQATELLGADLVIGSSQPIPARWLQQARDEGLGVSQVIEFRSVVLAGESMQLASVKAVAEGYPLRGKLQVSEALFAGGQPAQGIPAPGEVWLEPRLFGLLDVEPGGQLELGSAMFGATQSLVYESDRGGDFYSLAPRVMMNIADLKRAAVLRPGSRVEYRMLLAGDKLLLDAYLSWLRPRLSSNEQIITVQQGRPAISRALERAERYLGLASLVAVLLAGVAIAMGARRYSERHFDMSAMLRCMGASQRDLLMISLLQLLWLGLIGSLIGLALGWGLQEGLIQLLRPLLPGQLPGIGIKPVWLGLATGLITLAGFALPPVVRLRTVPPLRVLRRDLTPMPAQAWLIYSSAIATLVLLMWRYTRSAELTLAIVAGVLVCAITLGVILTLMLRLTVNRLRSRTLNVAFRFGLNHLLRNTQITVSQVLAFGMTLMAMAVVILIRTELVGRWQSELPEQTPNVFAVNILSTDVPALEQFLDSRQLTRSAVFPMVRGRLTRLNGEPILQAVGQQGRGSNALHRELNLTWSDQLPETNKLVSGSWWPADGDPDQPLVSIEADLAQRLGIKIGDRLGFSITGVSLEARVANIRSVEWESFRPNFYMVFPSGVLEQFASTYMTSFHRPEAAPEIGRDLIRQFPSVTVLDLNVVISQIRGIVNQVSLAVEYVLLFVLCAGFTVFFAAMQASLDERLQEGALMRTLGARSGQIRASHISEFVLLGALAGVVAAMGTETISYLLYREVFSIPFSWHPLYWLLLPIIGGVLVGGAGWWGTRRVVTQAPLGVLREL
ncbi:FtsX-like permease family protein [Aestuariirhabdus sp. Z084]|uniref:ABC transporter permease n=1 Tax=Aestuariirhabdus haliotis TaxID=2918751 RepID=UPI00201B42BC|nr:FtsX-like permease family protein [Aestuariirhabdus haliotis]MCL6415945.1 FtsX-like permease family protein [Aestuariirhabdus haliotis]MCL6419943.1 FtsX-like permease family protein [Aestuariirhabdus haliotis]